MTPLILQKAPCGQTRPTLLNDTRSARRHSPPHSMRQSNVEMEGPAQRSEPLIPSRTSRRGQCWKGSRLKVKQVTVDERDRSGLLLTVVVEKDVLKSREPVQDLLGRRREIELANWSGWRATLTSPTDSQDGLQDSNPETLRWTTVLWEGIMELDPVSELSPRTVTERLEELLRRLLAEGFQLSTQ